MAMIFFCILGAIAVLIQLVSFKAAFNSGNYWQIKRAITDIGCDAIVFVIAKTGGVGGFYIAVMASFFITIYLKFKANENKYRPEPPWWLTLKRVTNSVRKHF